MSWLRRTFTPFLGKSQPTSPATIVPVQPQPPQPLSPQPQSIEALEKQMAIEVHTEAVKREQRLPASPFLPLRRFGKRLLWMAFILGIPVGAIALINLPYAPIRRPIAAKAPFLLMPSYISMDQNLRQAMANGETAKQLIDTATTPADLELGEQKLKQAQANLDQLPTWVWSELPKTQSWWWYDWRLSTLRLNQARAEIGRLQGKIFQEKNAQTALVQAEQTLGLATQQTQEAQNPTDKQAALRVWQDALDQLRQIPAGTLAGKMAQQKLAAAQRDFEAIGGFASQNTQTSARMNAAREFARQAAQASQNPPHSVQEWEQVANLWQEAMNRLKTISAQDDPIGYQQAQKLLATYQSNYGQIKIRQKAEADAGAAYQQAQDQISRLISMSRTNVDRNQAIGQLQRIIAQLESIDSGTTVYVEAQQLLISAKQKQKEWQN